MAEQRDHPIPPPDGPPRSVGRLIRALSGRLRRNLATNLLVIGGLAAAIIGLGLAANWVDLRWRAAQQEDPAELPTALALLDAGETDLAREVAADVRQRAGNDPRLMGGAAYVLGAAMFADAEQEVHVPERRALFLLAARYLEESHRHGFPDGRAGFGDYLLGRAHYEAGRYAAGLEPLQRALPLLPQLESELHRLLADIHLRDTAPRLDQARQHNARYLELVQAGTPDHLRALLTQAEIEFELNDQQACLQTLQQLEQTVPSFEMQAAAGILRGRLLLRKGDERLADPARSAEEAAGDYAAARDALLQVIERGAESGDLIRQAHYLLGISFRKLGEFEAAEGQFSRTRRLNYDTAEGLAAGLHEAELMQAAGRHDEALDGYARVFRQAADLDEYRNRWLSWDELQVRGEEAFAAYHRARDFERALRLARALAPIVPEERALELQAEALRERALSLQQTGEKNGGSEAEPDWPHAREAWRQAAALYQRLAQLRFATRQYPETLWQAAEAYLKGHDYHRAVRMLQTFLASEARRGHPPALVALGEARLALNEPDEALQSLNECIAFFPKDPHTYRARLIAAQASFEAGDLARAKQLLADNLEHEALTPRSIEWRDSLYALGRLHYREGLRHETTSRLEGIDSPEPDVRRQGMKTLERAHGSFQEAISLLSEAVQRDELAQRDPFAMETIEARYLIAEAHRHAAKLPLHQLAFATIDTTRNQLNGEIQRALAAAEEAHRQLQQLLNTKQETAQLNDREKQLLRNTYFARADVLFDLENLEEAIQAYATATNRFQHEPESLEAYVQIAHCHRRLNRLAEARGTLEQAKVVLQRIRPDADFTSTTRYSRAEWQTLLDWLTTL